MGPKTVAGSKQVLDGLGTPAEWALSRVDKMEKCDIRNSCCYKGVMHENGIVVEMMFEKDFGE